MDFLEFRRKFDNGRSKLRLPTDCSEVVERELTFSTLYCWTLRWMLAFPDPKYLRIWEHYNKVAGLQESRRDRFVCHYGPIVNRDEDGVPRYQPQDAVDIRIDNVNRSPHLHYGAPDPHYPQKRVKGLDLGAIDMFAFVRAILKHRRTGLAINKILGFTLVN